MPKTIARSFFFKNTVPESFPSCRVISATSFFDAVAVALVVAAAAVALVAAALVVALVVAVIRFDLIRYNSIRFDTI